MAFLFFIFIIIFIMLTGRTVKTYLNMKKKIKGVGPVAANHRIDFNGQQITIQEYFLKKNIQLK